MARESRRSARQASVHKRGAYAESDSDEDFEYEGVNVNITLPATGRPPPAKRRRRAAADTTRSAYTEPNTDDEFEAAEPVRRQQSAKSESATPQRHRVKRTARPQTRSRAKGKRAVVVIGKPRRPNSEANPTQKSRAFSGPSDGRIPDWTLLPVNILKDIFVFGSTSENSHFGSQEARADVSWLIKAAQTCRAFAQPALEAYYESPVLFTNLQPHQLLGVLREKPPENRYMNYNVKIKSLRIDADVLAHVASGRPLFDLTQLVAELPQLQELEVLTRTYLPPFRLLQPLRWSYASLPIVQSMDDRDIHLKSWRWSRDLMSKEEASELSRTMLQVHSSRSFTRLQRLVLCGFNCDTSIELLDTGLADPGQADDGAGRPPALAAAIAVLPALTDLTFITCDIIMDKFLQFLPSNLRRLELTNCLEITSDIMREYFKTSGAHLEELVLNHNAALSLSFLTSLGPLCANLKVLRMDLTYYSERHNTKDADPLYDELLLADEIPSWPRGLRDLELLHAQKWSADAASNLFRSLIHSAADLQDLRRLVIHAHINIPWRDRVGFRDEWIDRLNRVFLRQSPDPFAYLGSHRQYRLWKQVRSGKDPLGEALQQVQISPQVQISRKLSSQQRSENLGSPSRSRPTRGRRGRGSLSHEESDTDSPISDLEPDDDEDAGAGDHIQGLCDIVDISIDNQRPRETHFTERDFLDSEKSGDEDWNENGENSDEEGYAW